jgi:hypothetical protein
MHRFGEEALQFIWKHRLLKPGPMRSVSGREIDVQHTGVENRDAGPDFFNGRIAVEGVTLAGNIELHLRTSDWLRHHHQQDRSYDRLILHVVYEHDTDLPQNTENGVEVLELKQYIDADVLERYRGFANTGGLPCSAHLGRVADPEFVSWVNRMAAERMEMKCSRISAIFRSCGYNYSQTFYTLLLRSYGLNVNALPFELLARHIPLTLLQRHADNLVQLEALLLGTAGLLDAQCPDDYIRLLQNEYAFLSRKYGLAQVPGAMFKYSRMRPANFPALRLAQFAAFMHRSARLVLHPESIRSADEPAHALKAFPSPYWKNHYRPGGSVALKDTCPGETAINVILINSFAPFLFFYGKKASRPEMCGLGMTLLEKLPAEINFKTKLFSAKGKTASHAAFSQGLIHLFDGYCSLKKCLDCGIGAAILRQPAKAEPTPAGNSVG